MKLTDLKANPLNPRTISPERAAALKSSIGRYGDLSGVVFNRRTGNLVGGHQRVAIVRKNSKGARAVTEPSTDKYGTVETGYVLVTKRNGGTERVPLRVVDWDGKTEMAANIAANAIHGEFDYKKLGQIVAGLEKNKFPIERLALDDLDWRRVRTAIDNIDRERQGKPSRSAPTAKYAPLPALKVGQCRCPRCGNVFKKKGSKA